LVESTTLETEPLLAEGVTERINREVVEALAAGEPEWLRVRRFAAWEV
jgi:hypothetical protein